MMSGPHTISLPAQRAPLRLRLKPKAPATGLIDGAWWPRSRDLAAELPELAKVLAIRLGQVERVAFAQTGWESAPRRLEFDGFRVRLEGFLFQDPNILYVTGANGGRISLLIIPPDSAEVAGHNALVTAGRRGNAERPEAILATFGIPVQRVAGDAASR